MKNSVEEALSTPEADYSVSTLHLERITCCACYFLDLNVLTVSVIFAAIVKYFLRISNIIINQKLKFWPHYPAWNVAKNIFKGFHLFHLYKHQCLNTIWHRWYKLSFYSFMPISTDNFIKCKQTPHASI